MNKIIIIGNLTGTPELRVTKSGVSVCQFTVAVNGRRKDDGATFFRVTAWRALGETCHKYLDKGRKAFPRACGGDPHRAVGEAPRHAFSPRMRG